MGKYESVPLPMFQGRPMITDEMISEQPHLQGMINRGSNYWSYYYGLYAYLGPAQKDAK